VIAQQHLVALEHAPKVIALSGHSDKLSRAAALDSGAAAYVTKSEGFDDLVRTILETCGRT
jgi:DNA-binding NarL/FixJ family response regulator